MKMNMNMNMMEFNPYYYGKDPMEEVLWRIKTDSGMWGFVRNPFAPGAEYGYDSTTYEKFQQSGFVQPEVDPYYHGGLSGIHLSPDLLYSQILMRNGFIQPEIDPCWN